MSKPLATWLLAAAALWACCSAAMAQSSSAYGPPDQRRPLTLYQDSWTAERPPEPKLIRLHDVVTVVINEQSVVISEGEIDRKKKAHSKMALSDWILLKGLTAVPDPQSAGEPRITGTLDNKLRSEASLETRDSMKFRIACTVVDIRPNGNLILEGRRYVRNNEETWEYAVTGEIRPEDILPNNTVLSENVAALHVDKRESGHVRDGYRRGWLLEVLDRWQPF
jgi:flagellar L-ring protein FlgH